MRGENHAIEVEIYRHVGAGKTFRAVENGLHEDPRIMSAWLYNTLL